MGPIEKKIKEILKKQVLSEETTLVLKLLENEVRTLEKDLVNRSYQQGVHDKESGRSLTWDYYSHRYNSYLSTMKIGEYK